MDGWIDPDSGQSLVAHIPVPVWLACAFCVQQGPVWALFASASTTTACEELLEAVAALRNTRQIGAAPGAPAQEQSGTSMASPNNLIRITGLLHFAHDVNRTAGLGLSIKSFGPLCGRRLVTVRFVWQLVVETGPVARIEDNPFEVDVLEFVSGDALEKIDAEGLHGTFLV